MVSIWASPQRAGRRRLLVLGSLAGVVLTALAGATPAAATVTDRSRATTPYQYESWDCGYPMDVDGVTHDQVHVRVDARTGVPFITDNFDGRETWTASDGRWFTRSWHGIAKDIRARSLGGSPWTFTNRQAGQPVVITDAQGAVVARDRGSLTQTLTIDVRDGSVVDVQVRVAGPHPMLDQDLCRVVRTLTGTDSWTRLTPHPLGSSGSPMGYDEYLPPSYSTFGPASPLIVALNGYGENSDGTASGLQALLNQGIPRLINVGAWPADRPFVVLASQHIEQPGFDYSPCGDAQWGGSCLLELQDATGDQQPAICTTADEAHAFIEYAIAHYNVDPRRIYLAGMSCAGFSAWEYLAGYGDEHVAAAVLASGEARPAWAHAGCALGSVPEWAFIGSLDDVVEPAGTIGPMTDLQACPGVQANEARLTIYPDLGHESWNPAFDGERGDDIYTWMLGFTNP